MGRDPPGLDVGWPRRDLQQSVIHLRRDQRGPVAAIRSTGSSGIHRAAPRCRRARRTFARPQLRELRRSDHSGLRGTTPMPHILASARGAARMRRTSSSMPGAFSSRRSARNWATELGKTTTDWPATSTPESSGIAELLPTQCGGPEQLIINPIEPIHESGCDSRRPIRVECRFRSRRSGPLARSTPTTSLRGRGESGSSTAGRRPSCQDEITTSRPFEALWSMHTKAAIPWQRTGDRRL